MITYRKIQYCQYVNRFDAILIEVPAIYFENIKKKF